MNLPFFFPFNNLRFIYLFIFFPLLVSPVPHISLPIHKIHIPITVSISVSVILPSIHSFIHIHPKYSAPHLPIPPCITHVVQRYPEIVPVSVLVPVTPTRTTHILHHHILKLYQSLYLYHCSYPYPQYSHP